MKITWPQLFNDELRAWLLEPDPTNPDVRYFTLVDLLGLPVGSLQALEARAGLMSSGPVPVILANQHPDAFRRKTQPELVPDWPAGRLGHRCPPDRRSADPGWIRARPAPGARLDFDPLQERRP